jgi:hypothetical protein
MNAFYGPKVFLLRSDARRSQLLQLLLGKNGRFSIVAPA